MAAKVMIVGKNLKRFLYEAISDNADNSLLTFKQSDAVKGILILLIIMGHNKYLMQGGMSNIFLYSFHVYAFYYLPFLYNFKDTPFIKLIKTNFRRLYIPYTVIFLLLLCLALLNGKITSPFDYLATYVCGSQFLLSHNFGFGSFLWFIPTMFSVLIYRWIYYHLNFKARCLMLFISLIFLIGFTYRLTFSIYLKNFAPFCLSVALAMVLPGVLMRAVYRKLNISSAILAFFLLVLGIMIVYPLKANYANTYLTINRLFCPIIIFSLLLATSDQLITHPLSIKLGQLSFKMYLIHIFIYHGLYLIAEKSNPGIYIGLLIYITCVVITYHISKISILHYIFPR